MTDRWKSLGSFPELWVSGSADSFFSSESISEILGRYPQYRSIDPAGCIEVISRYHCFADRTLIQGIQRTPWMARPDVSPGQWEFFNPPDHGNCLMGEDEAASELFNLLQKEILHYIEGRSIVGLLLSGGMDSRIVAGVLDHLVRSRDASVNVVALTWGLENSRDVRYAEIVSKRLGWEYLHLPISPDTLNVNIAETAKQGCEYSPVHLHAIPQVRDLPGLDCVLAASYGDSIGRAEYSGRHITRLKPFDHVTANWFKLVKQGVYRDCKESIAQDIHRYRSLFPRYGEYQQREVDQQAHYMRRKLNQCMAVVEEKIPLFQVFTSPEVFGFMWKLDPKSRSDLVYARLMENFLTDLSDIPWARTGREYLAAGEPMDSYPSIHHQYGSWIRNELYSTIREKALSSEIDSLQVFNLSAIEHAMEMNRMISKQVHATKMDEISIWLASLADFVSMYGITGTGSNQSVLDVFNGCIVSPVEVVGLSALKSVLG